MPSDKNPNVWKVKEKERKYRRKRREGEWKEIEWGKSNTEGPNKVVRTPTTNATSIIFLSATSPLASQQTSHQQAYPTLPGSTTQGSGSANNPCKLLLQKDRKDKNDKKDKKDKKDSLGVEADFRGVGY